MASVVVKIGHELALLRQQLTDEICKVRDVVATLQIDMDEVKAAHNGDRWRRLYEELESCRSALASERSERQVAERRALIYNAEQTTAVNTLDGKVGELRASLAKEVSSRESLERKFVQLDARSAEFADLLAAEKEAARHIAAEQDKNNQVLKRMVHEDLRKELLDVCSKAQEDHASFKILVKSIEEDLRKELRDSWNKFHEDHALLKDRLKGQHSGIVESLEALKTQQEFDRAERLTSERACHEALRGAVESLEALREQDMRASINSELKQDAELCCSDVKIRRVQLGKLQDFSTTVSSDLRPTPANVCSSIYRASTQSEAWNSVMKLPIAR
eukprot:gnl/TRDRNA2_/TRDRNA2_126063_c1_seq1.p1 gnl/TRDRNA2_/TRDRNA2_126063_c1~~gnl/TRDRNA2_/TRDRNA2_126063_c1_seq1.p1  ORF type:complete len:333 (+),score=73.51 gnl/TRDRNA2_/TRDRNA2_126063_c1_seq1:81-1079(+)